MTPLNFTSDSNRRVCHPHIVSAGLPGRSEKILLRDHRIYGWMLSDLFSNEDDDEDDFPLAETDARLTMEALESAFASDSPFKLVPATFLAGRCMPEQASDQELLVSLLTTTLEKFSVSSLRDLAMAYVETLMAVALKGNPEVAQTALRKIISGEIEATGQSYLAAFYLAQLGDPAGYPAFLQYLSGPNNHYKMMAVRHLLGFQPYDGQVIDSCEINLKSAFLDQLYNAPSSIQAEVPALMAEAEIEGLEESLRDFLKTDRDPVVLYAVQAILNPH